MKKIAPVVCFFICLQSWAQSFTVKKAKGKQALVEVHEGTLQPGQTYSLRGSGSTSGRSDRSHFVGISGLEYNFSSDSRESNSAKTSSTNFGLSLNGGWNLGSFEFGPTLGFQTSSGSGTTSSSLSGGGFFDFNFTPNLPGQSSIFCATAGASLSSVEAGGTKSSGYLFEAGAGWKFFPFNDWLSLRTNLKVRYSESKNPSTTTKTTSFLLDGGVVSYF